MTPKIVDRRRRRVGAMKRSTQARPTPPVVYQGDLPALERSNDAVVAAVLVMLSVQVCAAAPVIETDAGESAQVAGSLVAVGVMAQLSATAPVNPPDGVTLIVEVLADVAPGLTVMLPLFERAKAGATVVTETEPVPVALLYTEELVESGV
jgi:hypothetical protein